MYPREFEYFAPSSLEEAIELCTREGVRPIAGGQSMLPMLKLRKAAVNGLVDLSRIPALSGVEKKGDSLMIGPLVTTAFLSRDAAIASMFPILREASLQVADPLVRNLGTIGGNLCQADPVYDLPAVMLALDATMVTKSKNGERRIPSYAFFAGPRKTALSQGEILTNIEIPIVREMAGGAYLKLKKGSGGFTIVGVAAQLEVGKDGKVTTCRLGLTCAGDKPLRAREAERSLKGKSVDGSSKDKAAELAMRESSPPSDLNASSEYRKRALELLVKHALDRSYRRATWNK